MKQRLVVFLTLAGCLIVGVTMKACASTPTEEALTTLYRVYLNSDKNYAASQAAREKLRQMMSPSFNQLIDQNQELCEKKVKGEICGWAANGDSLLNAQDWGDDLNFENSQFGIKTVPGERDQTLVHVSLELLPSSPSLDPSTRRSIRFYIEHEGHTWSIADMVNLGDDGNPSGKTIVKTLQDEIAELELRPDLVQ